MVSMTLLKRELTQLTPTEFENLIFDLMVANGMSNASWRTPGPDGGRDIEGVIIHRDFSGWHTTTKWFVECKRYTGSVDWPTIYGKLAYADSNKANILLMCTSSQFTPQAINEVAKWNTSNRSIEIRLWPKHELELQLQNHSDLLFKYGLSNTPAIPGGTILSLSLALSKTVNSHYSSMIFKDQKPSIMLQASQAFSQLLLQRMEDIERECRIRPIFFESENLSIEKCKFDKGVFEIDEVSLTAFLTYLSALANHPINIAPTSDGCRITSTENVGKLIDRYRSTFSAIATWGDFELISVTPNEINLKQRK